MPEPAISRLKIDRNAPLKRSSRRRWWPAVGAVLVVGGIFFLRSSGDIAVETIAVTTAYPYQAVTDLNATGYVVAQRKAAVATKATGRLEWLGVQEGSVVKAGEVIARLESKDVAAAAEQAAAGVQ